MQFLEGTTPDNKTVAIVVDKIEDITRRSGRLVEVNTATRSIVLVASYEELIKTLQKAD